MDPEMMTLEEVQALLCQLTDWERKELALLMLERWATEQEGRLH